MEGDALGLGEEPPAMQSHFKLNRTALLPDNGCSALRRGRGLARPYTRCVEHLDTRLEARPRVDAA
jgi:hypothetical protein